MQRLEEVLVERLPIGEAQFPPDQVTDRSERFFAAEFVREQLVRRLGQELPFNLGVEVEAFEDGPAIARISVIVWVDRPGQKAIVVGEGGHMLREVGRDARKALESLLERKVLLKLWVKVKSGWSDDERILHRLGYTE